jgi:hypothetical protein
MELFWDGLELEAYDGYQSPDDHHHEAYAKWRAENDQEFRKVLEVLANEGAFERWCGQVADIDMDEVMTALNHLLCGLMGEAEEETLRGLKQL